MYNKTLISFYSIQVCLPIIHNLCRCFCTLYFFILQIGPLDDLDTSGIEPVPSSSGVSRQLLNEEPGPPQDLSISDCTNLEDTKPDATSVEQDTIANSSFRPYYESTFLLTSDALQDLLRWVEDWIDCDSNDDVDVAKNLMRVLLKLLRNVSEQCDTLKALRDVSRFRLSRFEGSDQDIRFWTGFYSYDALILFWEHYVEPNTRAIAYWGKSKTDWMEVEDKPGPKRKLLPIDEMFLTLVKLKRGSANRDIGERFGIHETHVSRIIVTWIKLLHTVLSEISIWIQRSKIRKHLPKCFQALYKDVRVIVDCTELRSERPSDFEVQCATYSTYKGCNTYKALIGISPSGVPTFISQLYEGSISDNDITNKTKLRDLMEPGDAMMADRGWTCANWLARKGVRLVTPHFLHAKQQMTIPELVESVSIARVRIHVERCMGRIKQWQFLKADIPLVYWNMISDIFQVCSRLVLFWPPLVDDE